MALALVRLEPGTPVTSDLRLVRELGGGGMGTVWVAHDEALGRDVAVKFIARDLLARRPSLAQRFLGEARAAAQLRNPHVVEIYDHGKLQDGTPFMVMELLEGESLRERLAHGPLARDEAVGVMQQLTEALSSAHDRGIVHRDIKPDNVFLLSGTRNPFVKVLDFGIAKDHGQHGLTATGSVLGTPAYMSPEQLDDAARVDQRADLWASAVLAYEMVTGRLPFVAGSMAALVGAIARGRCASVREVRPELPAGLDAWFTRAFSADIEARWDSAEAMAADFDAAWGDGATVAGPTNDPAMMDTVAAATAPGSLTPRTEVMPVEPTTRPSSRRRWWLALIPVGLLAVLAWGFGGERTPEVAAASLGSALPAPRPPVRLGTQSQSFLARQDRGERVAQHLSRRLLAPVELRPFDEHAALHEALLAGDVDLALVTSYSYVRLRKKQPDLQLLAAAQLYGRDHYIGAIVVKASSPAKTVKDLKGGVFCFVRQGSASGYLYPRALLLKRGIEPEAYFREVRYTGKHFTSLRELAVGKCDAVAVYENALAEAEQTIGLDRNAFRVIARTAPVPWDAIVASARLPATVASAARDALVALAPNRPEAQAVLAGATDLDGFVPTRNKRYDALLVLEAFLAPTR